ncbi:MAG: flagellar biosynthetic protein FliQ [Proteobacteria bacterium]|nr:flagellar biosynthetic protein FliQ [Pseudomonadota bacterium]
MQPAFPTATEVLIEVAREGLYLAALLSAPAVLAGLAVGLMVGAVQAATHIQEPIIGLVPRAIAVVAALSVCLPWMARHLVEFTAQLFELLPAVAGA